MDTGNRNVRVVVIGGGAAGAAAALAAAQLGSEVSQVRRAPGTTAMSSGALDLAADSGEMPGDPWQDRPPTSALLENLRRLQPRHPLAIAAVDSSLAEQILNGLSGEIDVLAFRPLENPALVLPTDLGTFKSTTLCQSTAQAGHLPGLSGARLGVVGFRDHALVDAAGLARSYTLAAARGGVNLEAEPVEVRVLRRQGEQHLAPPALATLMEQSLTLRRLVESLESEVLRRELTHLLLPPVMGLARWREVMEALNRLRPAFEMLSSAPPSVPGLRLQGAMDLALERRQVKLLRARARAVTVDRARVTSLILEGHPPVEGDVFVLATGKFASGGLVHQRALEEPLFQLPVWVGSSPASGSPRLGRHLGRDVAGPHPLMSAGVRVDRHLRPLDRDGRPALENLFAAGSVVGGYDYITDRCGLGTAMITGHLAGRNAAGGHP